MLRYIKYVLPYGPLALARMNKAKVKNIAKKEKRNPAQNNKNHYLYR